MTPNRDKSMDPEAPVTVYEAWDARQAHLLCQVLANADIEARVDSKPTRILDHVIHSEGQDFTRVGEIKIEIPARNAVVSLLAKNKHGFSDPAVFYSNWAGTREWYKSNLYVVAVGVNDPPRLKYGSKDAEAFVAAISGQKKGGLYNEITIKLLTSEKGNATKDDVLDGLEEIQVCTAYRLDGQGLLDVQQYRVQGPDRAL